VIAPDVGGGFGGKNAVYPEYLLAPVLYGLLARPVRSTQSRRESLVHMNHGRDQIHEVEIGFDDTGASSRCQPCSPRTSAPTPTRSG
jgi:aerobic carbon-monoxide dehydrogenase large subunit